MDIMSIIKFNGRYVIYFPYLETSLQNKICKWWGNYNTFDECFELMMTKNEYDHLEIDKKLLRKLKLNKIKEYENSKR